MLLSTGGPFDLKPNKNWFFAVHLCSKISNTEIKSNLSLHCQDLVGIYIVIVSDIQQRLNKGAILCGTKSTYEVINVGD